MTAAIASEPKKQPRELAMLFFAEMWERFSFYGMRALLVWYCANRIFGTVERPNDDVAYGIYGAYGALVYAAPFVGGLLADRLLGYKRAVLLGGGLMVIGHAVMAIESEPALYVALAFLIAGNGFFKPNISSLVGGLYGENDPRRDRGFTIFYMGINLGAFFQFVPSMFGERVSTAIGFGLAGVGMLIGLVVFARGQSSLGANGDPPDPALLRRSLAGPLDVERAIYLGAVVSVGLFAILVENYWMMGWVLPPIGIAGFGVVLAFALRAEPVARDRLFVVLVLILFNVVFWAFFEQAGSSINLFTFRNVDRAVLGQQIPATAFQSVNPAFIVIFAPLFTALWARLDRIGAEPSVPVKFSLGLLQLGLGFLVLGFGAYLASQREILVFDEESDTETRMLAAVVPLWILLLGYLLHTTGELCLSPIGLSMITKLTPKNIVAMTIGLWFLSTSLSHHVAGIIAGLTAREVSADPGQRAIAAGLLDEAAGRAPDLLSSYDQLASYASVFGPMGWFAIGSGVLLLALSPLLRRGMHGVR